MTAARLPAGAASALLEAAPDGIVLVGVDGRIEYVNQATLELFGYEREELVGVVVEQLIPARLRSRHRDDRAAYGEHPRPRPMGLGLRVQGLCRDGSEVPVEINLAPMESAGGPAFIAVVRDATERRTLEEERLRCAEAHAMGEIAGRHTQAPMMEAAGETAKEPAGEEDAHRRTLLLVEDEPALRTLVVTMLEEKGYAVLQAGNGLDAIAVAQGHCGEIDLLLTDVAMPRLSGPELAQRLETIRPGLRVLFMSGYSDSRLVNRGVARSSANLLVKPFTPDQLIRRVAELTGREA